MTGTVADISDAALVERAVRSVGRPRRASFGGMPRWSLVADRFALGSTYATQLCHRFGLDPDEKLVKR